MGKYSSRARKPAGPDPKNTVNPYMRGIGCLLMVVVPVFSYLVGSDLAGKGIGLQILSADWYKLANHTILPASLAIAVVVTIVVGGIISIIFGYMYNLLSPAKYSGMDVPAPRVKTKKYKR